MEQETSVRRYKPRKLMMIRYTGTNGDAVSAYFGDDGWSTMEGRYPRVNDWVYRVVPGGHWGFLSQRAYEELTEEIPEGQ